MLLLFLTFGIPIIALIGLSLLVYFLNKKEITEDQLKRHEEEIKQAVPYENIDEAKRQIISTNSKVIFWFGLYFLFSIPILVLIFGKIEYGANLPYTVFLFMNGVPFLILFAYILTKVEKQRIRLLASGIDNKSASSNVMKWVIIIPIVFVILINIMLKISNQLLD